MKTPDEIRAAAAARQRIYRARHPERSRASLKRYQKSNRGLLADRARVYRAEHPEKVIATNYRPGAAEGRVSYVNRKRAEQAGTPAPGVTPAQWRELLEIFGHCCAYCLKPKKLERDHVIPIKRGGADSIENTVPACRSCNARKHNKLLIMWVGL